MEPIEFLHASLELRSFFRFFRDKSPCSGIKWAVPNGVDISEGQTLGHFVFTGHAPVPIISPIEGVLVRRIEVDGSALHQRPSQLVALLAPPRERGEPLHDEWHDISERLLP